MQKQIHILNGGPKEGYNEFKHRMFTLADAIIDRYKPETLRATLTLQDPPRVSVIPFRRRKVGVFSLTGPAGDLPGLMAGMEGYVGGYDVEEAIPVAYHKSWKDREPTPGVCLLTLFHGKPGIDQATFIDRWHNGHTPLSLRLHPLWNYNRNVVKGTLIPSSRWYDGIVEEQFRNRGDLLNPFKFFGPPLRVPLHMVQVYRDTNSFIDMKRIETYLATEYHLKS